MDDTTNVTDRRSEERLARRVAAAAAAFTPDTESALAAVHTAHQAASRRRRRTRTVIAGAAALALVGGSALAFGASGDAPPLQVDAARAGSRPRDPAAASTIVPSASAVLRVLDDTTSVADLGAGDSERGAYNALALITSGLPTREQVEHLRSILEGTPGVDIDRRDDVVTIQLDSGSTLFTLTYDGASGRPLRSGWVGVPEGEIEYVSVTRVRAEDVLVPGRGTPTPPISTTMVPVVPTSNPWPSIAAGPISCWARRARPRRSPKRRSPPCCNAGTPCERSWCCATTRT